MFWKDASAQYGPSFEGYISSSGCLVEGAESPYCLVSYCWTTVTQNASLPCYPENKEYETKVNI